MIELFAKHGLYEKIVVKYLLNSVFIFNIA